MPGRLLYEYAVIRVVPRVEREEFVNAGVVIYCAQRRLLQAIMQVPEQRVLSLYADADLPMIAAHLDSFVRICAGQEPASPIAALDAGARFRWLTALRSTVIQTSRVHAGFCEAPEQALQRLLEAYVL